MPRDKKDSTPVNEEAAAQNRGPEGESMAVADPTTVESQNVPASVEAAEDRELERDGSLAESAEDMSKSELKDKARELDVEGRSKMDKDELAEAVAAAESKSGPTLSEDDDEKSVEQLLVEGTGPAGPGVATDAAAGGDAEDAEEAARQLTENKNRIAEELGEEYVTRFTQGGSSIWTQER